MGAFGGGRDAGFSHLAHIQPVSAIPPFDPQEIDMMHYERVLASITHGCAENGKKVAQEAAMVGTFQPLFLYFKKASETENGDLVLVPDQSKAPDGFELATGESLRGNVPYDRFYQWVRERVSRLPLLAPCVA